MNIALTPYDRGTAKASEIAALVLLRRKEAFLMLRDFMGECSTNGWHWFTASTDGLWGVALVVQGEIGGESVAGAINFETRAGRLSRRR